MLVAMDPVVCVFQVCPWPKEKMLDCYKIDPVTIRLVFVGSGEHLHHLCTLTGWMGGGVVVARLICYLCTWSVVYTDDCKAYLGRR